MSGKRKFVFLYLNTGGGHRSAANVLSECITQADPDSSVVQVNAFDTNNVIGHTFFEKPYHFSMNWDPGIYSSFYRLARLWKVQSGVLAVMNPRLEKYLTKVFEREQPTDIIVFHFLVVDAVKRVLAKTGMKVNVRVVVLDPFTCHNSWFYRKDADFLVYSNAVKNYAIACGVPEKNIQLIPFLLGKKFRSTATPEEVAALKKKHNLPSDRKILLITGGGEGLPKMIPLVQECIRRHEKFSVCVVCGRDKTARKTIELLALKDQALSGPENAVDIHVFSFVDYMDELVKCCDCAVIKAGPASLIEVLSQKKPVVLCSFIYGQEAGNVDFAIRNRVGIFKRKSRDIIDYVEKLFNNEAYYNSIQNNLQTLPLDVNCDKITDILLKE